MPICPESFNVFMEACNKIAGKKLYVEDLKRYLRLSEGHGLVAFCFVDKANGDVLKAALFNRPAKHARGNIYDSQGGLGEMTPSGPAKRRAGKRSRK